MYEVEPLKNINFAATGVEEILQNVAFIMSTSIMSCPLDREFGWNMGIDDPIVIRKAKIVYELTEAITKFEPRAVVESVTVTGDGLQGKLRPKVKVSINESI
ncbi:MAG: hypothetical protein RR651_14125 [Lysinibacillus sp.]